MSEQSNNAPELQDLPAAVVQKKKHIPQQLRSMRYLHRQLQGKGIGISIFLRTVSAEQY